MHGPSLECRLAAAIAQKIATLLLLNLMREEGLAEAQATAIALQWVKLNYVRNAMVLAAWLAALKAFSLRARHAG